LWQHAFWRKDLLFVHDPVSHESTFDNAVKSVGQYPGGGDHSRRARVASLRTVAVGPALDNMVIEAAVNDLIDSLHDALPLFLG
jgi:hypothetical protein